MALQSMEMATSYSHEADLDDLRKPVLQVLDAAGIALGFVWLAVAATLNEHTHALAPLLAPAALFVFSCISLTSSSLPLSWRSILFLVGMAIAVGPWSGGATSWLWLFFQPLVVVVSALLMGPAASFSAAALLTTATVVVFGPGPGVPGYGLLPPFALTWATAIASWLSSRNLYTVLSWALTSQRSAWEAADEARRRRGELRRTVDSLRTTHEVLERTTRELELARREAEEARRLKTEFVSNISHELRTPLNNILGFTEIMSRSPEVYGDMLWPPMLRGDILEIRRNASHLASFVDDILDLARIDTLHMPLHRVTTSLPQVVSEAVGIVHSLLEKKPVALEVALDPDLPMLYTDPTRIRQVLINLLTNACRFTERGKITVTAELKGDEVLVCVADTGSGIPPEKLELVFSEFEQAGAWQRAEESGKGLGLAIAKHLVGLHGGRIWAESKLGEGTRMMFVLPLEPGAASTLVRTPGPRQTASRVTSVVVLCAHDYPYGYLARRMEGFELRHARTTAQARKMVSDWHPAAVIVDLGSFGGRGSRTIGELDLPAGVPVIGCYLPSRRLVDQDGQEMTLLVKPVMPEALLSVAQRLAPRGEVMVVDDDRGFVQFVGRTFRSIGQGQRLRWAYNAEEALAKMRAAPPALALLDIVLPKTNGLTLAQAMRADASLADVPVVFVSGARLPEEALPTGRDTFVVAKPAGLTGDQVLQMLKSVLATVKADYVSQPHRL